MKMKCLFNMVKLSAIFLKAYVVFIFNYTDEEDGLSKFNLKFCKRKCITQVYIILQFMYPLAFTLYNEVTSNCPNEWPTKANSSAICVCFHFCVWSCKRETQNSYLQAWVDVKVFYRTKCQLSVRGEAERLGSSFYRFCQQFFQIRIRRTTLREMSVLSCVKLGVAGYCF